MLITILRCLVYLSATRTNIAHDRLVSAGQDARFWTYRHNLPVA